MFKEIKEDEHTTYIECFGFRAIIKDGEYIGWYNPNLSEVL